MRKCEFCGNLFSRKRFKSGRLEDFSNFKKRRFCSVECCNKARRDPNLFPRTILPPELVCDRTLEYRGNKFIGKKCEKCSSERKLQTHHIDGDKKNNEKENIMTLCKKCHDTLHARMRNP